MSKQQKYSWTKDELTGFVLRLRSDVQILQQRIYKLENKIEELRAWKKANEDDGK